VVVLVGHRTLFRAEHTWLVHVDPEVVKMAASGESVWFVHALPVVSCLTIEEVNPCGVSRPTLADEDFVTTVLDKEVFVCLGPDGIVFVNLNLRVCNYDDCSILIFNLLIH
jgi:hypothetical protein